jgi:hypothetical protein
VRNYVKFWLTVLVYDDGFGGTYPFTNFFESEAQRNKYFEAPWPIPPAFIVQINFDEHIWMWLNKRNLASHLNIAYGGGLYTPSGPPLTSFSTPNGQWGLKNTQYFVRADQDPIR